MAGTKGKSGGRRPNQTGRPRKADEQALVERLTPLDDLAFAALEKGLQSGEFPYVKMFFEYRFGKPQDNLDITSKGEAFNIFLKKVK